jgi:YebC/PmpR family DNA-binding regulatory protein
MSGHSKWSTIKRKKGTNDAKRGKLFTKLIKEILVSARSGGDENANPRLRTAVQNAKMANMPQATIDRAIRRGTGEDDEVEYEEGLYEGYGPGGVAIMVETLTDNRNRTVAQLRHVFSKYNGNLAENGSVAWMFDQKGLVEVEKSTISEEDLMLAVIDAGAEDIHDADEVYEISVSISDFEAVKKALNVSGLNYLQASLVRTPQNLLELQSSEAEQIIHLLEALEDIDDVQKVFSNFDVREDDLQRLIG